MYRIYKHGQRDLSVIAKKSFSFFVNLNFYFQKVTITGQLTRFNTSPTEESFRTQQHLLQDSLENILEEKEAATASLQFHENRGRNVVLSCSNTLARRSHSYNQGKES